MTHGIQDFGGDWTQDKLMRLEKYLSAYTQILTKYPYRIAYIDAFAGTGYREQKQDYAFASELFDDILEEESQRFLVGSAYIALKTEPRFNKYIFIEKDPRKNTELGKLKDQFSHLKDDIKIVQQDANQYIQSLCLNSNWDSCRAVLFLDPFGMQVEWETIKAIAHTQAIDLWLLFPLGVGVNRMLKRDGKIDDGWRNKLNKIFGEADWYDAFYEKKREDDLLGTHEYIEKIANFDRIGQYFVRRLETIFSGVSPKPLALLNSRNNPLFLLCFAAGNPIGAKTAVKIANHILEH
ncbi:three-Cys-motif partner protein TcmP [Candidatus Sumerlaeota bacterium]|nr:three-Cys-motif partner protein TcmP [Candidatus Sumerlaeota bacterium]